MTGIVEKSFNLLIPFKVNTLDEFMEVLEKEGATYVNAKMGKKQGGFVIPVEANTNDYRFLTIYSSRGRDWNPIKFKENYDASVNRFDIEEFERTYYRAFLTVDDRFKKIRARLPEIKTNILHVEGGYIDEKLHQELLGKASTYCLQPF